MQRAQQRTAKDDFVFPAEFVLTAQALRRKFLHEDSSVVFSCPLKMPRELPS